MAIVLRSGIECLQHFQRGFKILAGRRERPEDVLVVPAEDFIGSAAAFDHGYAVALGDKAVRNGNAAGVWAQKKVHLILGNELLNKLRAFRGIALVVIVNDFKLVFLVTHFDAAVLVNLFNGHIIGVPIQLSGAALRTRKRYGTSQLKYFHAPSIGR